MRAFRMLLSVVSKMKKVIYLHYLRREKSIFIEGDLILKSIPMIDVRFKSKIFIGNNVTLNSNNNGYHVNMHSPVKILADGECSEIVIGKNTRINGACIHAKKNIIIGDNCLIAANCQIIDSNGHEMSFDNVENRINTVDVPRDIVIENNVWIGANSFILSGVIIGEGSVISANSVVVKNIPKMVLAGGNPAVVIKSFN